VDLRQAFSWMQAAGILMRARGDRLSVASRAPLTEQQRTWIRAHKVELLRLLTQAVPSPAELKGEDREAIEKRTTFRMLDGGASRKAPRKATVERPPSSLRVYRYGLLDKPDTWLTMIAPDCDLEEARRSLVLRFGERLTAVVAHLRGC
jgi:hypothetical protein